MTSDKSRQNREYLVGGGREWAPGIFRGSRKVQGWFNLSPVPPLYFQGLFRRIIQGLARLKVAGRYGLSKMEFKWPALRPGIRLSWWKIGLVVMAVFVLLKKDIQLSVDLKSPVGAAPRDDDEGGDEGGEAAEFNLAQPASLPGVNDFRPVRAGDLAAGRVWEYIDRFRDLAVSEMKQFGIPASIKMAQALLESRAGQHPAARQLNNHFGRPLAGQHFNNVWENWREHSLLIYHEYPSLFDAGADYKKWAMQLRKARYSKDRDYDAQLIGLIEEYQLYLLDE